MRVAICFSGQPRYIEEGFFYVKKYFLDKYQNVDVFVHTWWSTDYIGEDLIGTNRKLKYESDSIDKIKKYYNPVDIICEKQIDFKLNDNVSYGLQNPLAVYSMFYSIYKSNKLKSEYEEKNNFQYDLVIRCRFDIVINYFDLDLSLKDRYIFVGGEHHHNGIKYVPNDQFAVSSSENMDFYSSVYNFIFDYAQDEKFNLRNRTNIKKLNFVGEQLLEHHFRQNYDKLYFTKTHELHTNGWWQYSNNDCDCWNKFNCGNDIYEVIKFKELLNR